MSSYIHKLFSEWSYKTSFMCPLQWELIDVEKTSKMMFHTGTIINDYLYIHGGSSNCHQFSTPVKSFYRFHFQNKSWENLTHYPNNPSLSNHACVSLLKRYFVLIGGWNGKHCESNIYIFDTKKMNWNNYASRGLPEELEGLACHTANKIKSPKRNPEILILASNTKVNKHHTLAFRLVSDKNFKHWNFIKLPNRVYFQLDHAVVSIGKNTLHCIGGNFSKLLQKIHVYHIKQNPKDNLVSTLITHVEDNKFNNVSAMMWSHETCRGHSTISGKNGFLFLNGIKYITSTVYTKNVFAYLNLGTKKGLYYVGDIKEKMAFGVCVTETHSGKTYYHGGIDKRNTNESQFYQLNFVFRENRKGICKNKDFN